MSETVYGQPVMAWVAARLGVEFDPGQCAAIGLRDGEALLAGVVYTGFRDGNIEMHIATAHPRWCSRRTLRLFFAYPFLQLGCRRVTAICKAGNRRIRAFLQRSGWTIEGLMRRGFEDDDAVIFGMLREDCYWIEEGCMGRSTQKRPPEPAGH